MSDKNGHKPDSPDARKRAIASVVIVEDHPLFSDALSITLQITAGIGQIHTSDSIASCVELLQGGLRPDLIFLDLNLPDAAGLDGLLRVRAAAGNAAIVIVSSLSNPTIVASALEHGAVGFVPKHSPRHTFQAALTAVAEGRVFIPEGLVLPEPGSTRPVTSVADKLQTLTAQQSRILTLLSEGKLNKQIAHELSIAESTVKAHVTVIMRKLEVQTRTQAVLSLQSAKFDSLASD